MLVHGIHIEPNANATPPEKKEKKYHFDALQYFLLSLLQEDQTNATLGSEEVFPITTCKTDVCMFVLVANAPLFLSPLPPLLLLKINSPKSYYCTYRNIPSIPPLLHRFHTLGYLTAKLGSFFTLLLVYCVCMCTHVFLVLWCQLRSFQMVKNYCTAWIHTQV